MSPLRTRPREEHWQVHRIDCASYPRQPLTSSLVSLFLHGTQHPEPHHAVQSRHVRPGHVSTVSGIYSIAQARPTRHPRTHSMSLDPSPAAAFDCRQCGACCHAREGTLLVSAHDLTRWKRSDRQDILTQLAPGHFSQQAFAMSHRGACVHLGMPGADLDCSIYATRATVCRELQVGSRQCLEARRERERGR